MAQQKNHHHKHTHTHAHDEHGQPSNKTFYGLIASFIINMALSVLEFAGGVISGSASLIGDALHNTSDAFSILIAVIALKIGRKKADDTFTYGFKRAEVIGGFVNLILLFVSGLYLVVEGIERLFSPEPIAGKTIVIISIIALIIDVATAKLSHTHAHDNVNMRLVFLHNMSDAFGSIGVIVSGLCVMWFNIFWIDGAIALLIATYMIYYSITGLPPIIRVLMNATPSHIDIEAVKNALNQLEGVENTHHLHLWHIDEKEVSLECHLVAKNTDVIHAAAHLLEEKFNIRHANIQVEAENNCHPCHL